jgi:hypothetical protein
MHCIAKAMRWQPCFRQRLSVGGLCYLTHESEEALSNHMLQKGGHVQIIEAEAGKPVGIASIAYLPVLSS